ncbi:MAG: histidine--tRNA ligase [Candidatus Aenigmarchaeota archaeon]|nr:histidine--tRNA ligase [Candidatus Aenigmarchaeota archaeon]
MVSMKARLESAQHILWRILKDDYKAKQTGMQFYENKIRIDVKCQQDLTKIPKEEFEERVNSVIRRNLPIIKKLYERKDVPEDVDISTVPYTAEEVIIVSIGDFDIQPCGNPHVNNTSEIGEYKLLDIKRKGKDIYRFVGAVLKESESLKSDSYVTELSDKEKLQPPRGTRDFFPKEMILREKVFDTVKKVFKRYGFDPYKTPAFENYELFAVKESIGKESQDNLYIFEDKSNRKLALRFDQTVPFSRQVASNPQLTKPIKRYEISRVWRYEEVKKGRYREFWQCDVDIVGTEKIEADAEIIDCTLSVLEELGFNNSYMRINNRKLLSAIMQFSGVKEERVLDAFRAIDKLDKIGLNGVSKELKDRGISDQAREKILEILNIQGNPREIIEGAKSLIGDLELGKEGVKLLSELVKNLENMGRENIILDLSLVRGFDYYNSTIFEAMSKDKSIGSLAGGGRYDNMIGSFANSNKEIPAVGVGIGIERIIDLLKEREDIDKKTYTEVFVINVNDQLKEETLKITQKLRDSGLNTQSDLMGRPLSKQLDYANSLGIPYTVIIGPREVESGKFKLKNMKTGEEKDLTLEKIIDELS